MIFGALFELLGAITVGARTASTIKNKIIPLDAFRENAGVQMLAFTCALAGASSWVMWCTRHSAHVSSSYSLISAVAGVGVAVAGASNVEWGWNGGQGLGAIFAGLGMAPCISAGFAATIFMLIKLTVHIRKNPVPWALWTSPFFFLIAGTVCALSIVYKGSPKLGLASKPAWYIASVSLGVGVGLFILSFIFFVPYLYAKVVNKDGSVKWYHVPMGPLLLRRPPPPEGEQVNYVPDYAVVQADKQLDDGQTRDPNLSESEDGVVKNTSTDIQAKEAGINEKSLAFEEAQHTSMTYKELMQQGEARFHAKLRQKKGLLGWAMRYLHNHPLGAGEVYERKNIITIFKRIPAQITVALMYGVNYDIHAAQSGVHGTPEGRRMERVYSHAKKYPNEVEHTYSFVQVITACTASFAHGANDIGNAVGPWAVIYSAWKTGDAAQSKADVPLWQLAVLSLTLSCGLITYGYNIMKVMGNKITYHSPSRGCSMELGAAITVLLFSQYKLPVSTSMCITGATVGVGLMNGTYKAVNWQRVGLLAFSWLMTIPIAGTLAGVLAGIVLNAPHF